MSADKGKRISDLIDKDRWTEARKLILAALKDTPGDHWLLDRLSLTYYEQRNYVKALEIIREAYKLAPKCPLVIWDYAGALDMVDESSKALKLYLRLFNMGERSIACGDHGEGRVYARSLLADCAFRISLCHLDLRDYPEAWKWILRHISMRDQGAASVYLESEVKEVLGCLSRLMGKTSSADRGAISLQAQQSPQVIQTLLSA